MGHGFALRYGRAEWGQMEQRCWAQVRHKWRHVRLWFGGRSEGVTAMLMPRS